MAVEDDLPVDDLWTEREYAQRWCPDGRNEHVEAVDEAVRRVIGMRSRVTLSSGGYAWVDATDLPVVEGYRWHITRKRNGKVYAQANIRAVDGGRTTIFMHRLVLGLQPGDPEVDHRDHNGLNNCRSNLRLAGVKNNSANRRKQSTSSTSRFKGVSRRSDTGQWRAYIQVEGRQVRLGVFESEMEAARAYDVAALEAWGSFAALNLPRS